MHAAWRSLLLGNAAVGSVLLGGGVPLLVYITMGTTTAARWGERVGGCTATLHESVQEQGCTVVSQRRVQCMEFSRADSLPLLPPTVSEMLAEFRHAGTLVTVLGASHVLAAELIISSLAGDWVLGWLSYGVFASFVGVVATSDYSEGDAPLEALHWVFAGLAMGGGTLTSAYQLTMCDGAFRTGWTVAVQAVMFVGGLGVFVSIAVLVALSGARDVCPPSRHGVPSVPAYWTQGVGLATAFISWHEQLILVALSVQTWTYARAAAARVWPHAVPSPPPDKPREGLAGFLGYSLQRAAARVVL